MQASEIQRVRELEIEIEKLEAQAAEKAHTHRSLPSERDAGLMALSHDAELKVTVNRPFHHKSNTLHHLKAELDSLVAGECLMCGDKMIDSISRPFVDIRDEEEYRAWYV